MLAIIVPVESVVAESWLTVPSLELSVMGRFGTGLPFESAAAADSIQGPLGEPEYTGVPRITRLVAAITGVTVNCAADEVPAPAPVVVTVTAMVPADAI